MSDYNMRGIPAELVPRFWHYAEPYIKRALDHTSGELLPEDVEKLLLDRDMQLWLISYSNTIVGAVTTEIVNYPRRKHCRVVTLAGNRTLSEWLDLVDTTLCEWARNQQCDALETFVRKGLVPKLAPLSYQHKHSVLIKELSDV